MAHTPQMTLTLWALLVLLGALFGASFIFVELALEHLPVMVIVWVRLMLGAGLIAAITLASGVRIPIDRDSLFAFAVMGLLNNAAPFVLFVWSQTHLAAGVAAILNATAPIFTVVVAHFATRDEPATAPKIIGVLIGFVGVAVMIGVAALSATLSHLLAYMAGLTAAACYAVAGVFGRRFARKGVAPLGAASGQLLAAALILTPIVIVFEPLGSLAQAPAQAWIGLIGLGVFSTALAYTIYFIILARAGATNVILVTFLVPVCAIALGRVFLGEAIQINHWIGLALITISLAVMDGRLLRPLLDKRRFRLGSRP